MSRATAGLSYSTLSLLVGSGNMGVRIFVVSGFGYPKS